MCIRDSIMAMVPAAPSIFFTVGERSSGFFISTLLRFFAFDTSVRYTSILPVISATIQAFHPVRVLTIVIVSVRVF